MGPKKSARNAQYYYVMDKKPELERMGHKVKNIQDLFQVALPFWKGEPPDVKAKYEALAKQYKAEMKSEKGDKFRRDNTGQCLADRKDPVKERRRQRERDRADLLNSWPSDHKELVSWKFYCMGVQHVYKSDEDNYWPCELAVIEYSLEEGLIRYLHRFPQPDKLPLGSALGAKEKCNEEHQIDVNRFDQWDSDHRQVYRDLCDFIPLTRDQETPPVFCAEKDVEELQCTLQWLFKKAQLPRILRQFRVISGEDLMMSLFSHAGAETIERNVAEIFDRSVYENLFLTRCEFHDEHDTNYCALFNARKIGYYLSDMLSETYGLTLTDKHLPAVPVNAEPTPLPEPEEPMYVSPPGAAGDSRHYSSTALSTCSDVRYQSALSDAPSGRGSYRGGGRGAMAPAGRGRPSPPGSVASFSTIGNPSESLSSDSKQRLYANYQEYDDDAEEDELTGVRLPHAPSAQLSGATKTDWASTVGASNNGHGDSASSIAPLSSVGASSIIFGRGRAPSVGGASSVLSVGRGRAAPSVGASSVVSGRGRAPSVGGPPSVVSVGRGVGRGVIKTPVGRGLARGIPR